MPVVAGLLGLVGALLAEVLELVGKLLPPL
jgi:hypothetical protein